MNTLERPSPNGQRPAASRPSSSTSKNGRSGPGARSPRPCSSSPSSSPASSSSVPERRDRLRTSRPPSRNRISCRLSSATGTVNPQNTINVGTQVSGTISEVDVDYNSKVKKGQVLARLDPTALQAQLELGEGAARAIASASRRGAKHRRRRDHRHRYRERRGASRGRHRACRASDRALEPASDRERRLRRDESAERAASRAADRHAR